MRITPKLIVRALCIAAVVEASILVKTSARSDEFHVFVSGHIDCLDNGVPRALANAHVEIMDSDNDAGTFGDDLMGITDTNVNGDFAGDGIGGDGGNWSWSKPDVYVRILLDDQWTIPVRMKDDLGSTESLAFPQHDHDNVEGNVSVGSRWWGSQASTEEHNSAGPCIWLTSHEAAARYVTLTHNLLPEGKYEIQYWAGVYATPGIYPFTTLATTYWPRHYSMYLGTTNTHEFYHALRHGLDGDQAHWDWDDVRFRYGRSHEYCDSKHLAETQENREGFAFNEGWAQFAGLSFVGSAWRCNPAAPMDMTLEGDVAVRLSQLEADMSAALTASGSPEPARKVMLAILRDHPWVIHTFDQYCRAADAAVPGACGAVPKPFSVAARQVQTEMSSATQMKAVQAEVEAQRASARQLIDALNHARQVSRATRPICSGEDCERVFNVLVKPALLEREIRVRELVARRLSALVGTTRRPAQPLHVMERVFQADTASFQRQILRVNVDALEDALRAAETLTRNSPAALPLSDRLRDKLAKRIAGAIPQSDMPQLLVMQDASGTTLR